MCGGRSWTYVDIFNVFNMYNVCNIRNMYVKYIICVMYVMYVINVCIRLTIAPALLEELGNSYDSVERQLDASSASKCVCDRIAVDEKSFRWAMNEVCGVCVVC